MLFVLVQIVPVLWRLGVLSLPLRECNVVVVVAGAVDRIAVEQKEWTQIGCWHSKMRHRPAVAKPLY